jgi:hypothetical protein
VKPNNQIDWQSTRSAGVLGKTAWLSILISLWTADLAFGAQLIHPNAKAVLAQYTCVTGGQAAYDRVRNRITEATLSVSGFGLTMEMTITQAKPNCAYLVQESPATGRVEQGSDGTVVWSNSALTGPQLKEGRAAADALATFVLDRWVYWSEAFERIEWEGRELVGEQTCDKLTAYPKNNGNPQGLYFDRDTHLLVKVTGVIEEKMGRIDMESFLQDYQSVDGIMLPHRVRVVLPALKRELVTTIKSCRHNVEIPEGRFDLPAEVRALTRQ